MGDNFLIFMFIIGVSYVLMYIVDAMGKEQMRKDKAIGNLDIAPFNFTTTKYVNYNFPQGMEVKEVVLVITKSGNMKLKVSLNEKNEVYAEYLKRISLRANINDFKDDEYDHNNTYIIDINREDAKALTEHIIRQYFKYDGKIYYQEVIISQRDEDGLAVGLEYNFIERRNFYNRI